MILIGFDEAIEEAQATSVDVWYNSHLRLWEISKRDDDGNQVGDTVYAYGKKKAMMVKAEMEEELR